MFEDKCGLRSVEARLDFVEAVHGAQLREQFAALDELQKDIEVLVVLGVALVGDHEGVVDHGHDEHFVFDVFDLL